MSAWILYWWSYDRITRLATLNFSLKRAKDILRSSPLDSLTSFGLAQKERSEGSSIFQNGLAQNPVHVITLPGIHLHDPHLN